MRPAELILRIDPDPRVPLFRRLARAVVQAIREGRLRPGDPLPGARQLAEQGLANRKTVMEAIRDLEADGWVVCEPSRGTFVAPSLPLEDLPAPVGPPRPAEAGFDLSPSLAPLSAQGGETLYLADGHPDPRLAPSEALAKGYQRALRRHGPRLLDLGEPLGNAHLREALALWLSSRGGYAVRPGELLVTRGGRAAMALLGLALCEPGDAIAVEVPGNRHTWDALGQRGNLRLKPVRVDQDGLDPQDLERVLAEGPIRALCLTPRCQYPTTATLTPERRKRILALSEAHRFAILEEAGDADHGFQEPQELPLAAQDAGGRVIHVACFSQLLAPGLRLGCIVAAPALVERLARLQRSLEWQGDRVLEWTVADLIRDGDLDRQLRRTRGLYGERREHLARTVTERLGHVLEVAVPRAGLSLWCRPRGPLPLEAWVQAARLRGLVLHPPSMFHPEGAGLGLRLGYAQHDLPVLDVAVERLAAALEDARGTGPGGRS